MGGFYTTIYNNSKTLNICKKKKKCLLWIFIAYNTRCTYEVENNNYNICNNIKLYIIIQYIKCVSRW